MEFLTLVDGSPATKGRNLLRNSSFSSNYNYWTVVGMANYASFTTKGGYPCMKIESPVFQSNTIAYYEILPLLISGQPVTISADVWTENMEKGTTNPFLALYTEGINKENKWVGRIQYGGSPEYPINNGKRDRIWTTIHPNVTNINDLSYYNLCIYTRDFKGKIFIKNVKLEYGSTATAWSAAPEEVS